MDSTIQWYPGHIAKLERELQQVLKKLDLIIEVVDARIPRSTWNRSLSDRIRQQKPTLLILNKSDLADPTWTERWVRHFRQFYPAVLPFDSSSGRGKSQVVDEILGLGESVMQRQESKGLKRRPVRVGVFGMPNVGKSSLINALVGRKKAQTGHRAGVTRAPQWVRIHPLIELLDTPGLIPPKLDSPETGFMLASSYSIGDAAFDEETITPYFIQAVESFYPGLLNRALNLEKDAGVSLESIAQRRLYLLPGGEPDLKRAAQAVLKDYRLGKLGRLTIERPAP